MANAKKYDVHKVKIKVNNNLCKVL